MKRFSVISAVMNRGDRLEGALANWLAADGVAEVVLVDWSSSIPVKNLIAPCFRADRRLRVVRVNHEPTWILSHALNLAASLASQPWLAKLDIDYRITPDFLTGFHLDKFSFVRGNWGLIKDPEDIHLNGFFMLRKSHFFEVNGYNENILTYGYEDTDLYARLMLAGLSPINLFPLGIEHIPHSDAMRTSNQPGVDKVSANRQNQQIASQAIRWERRKWRKVISVGEPELDQFRYEEFECVEE